jgi:ubiquinone/menaquinone biosynthesis C-methylase UbiE
MDSSNPTDAFSHVASRYDLEFSALPEVVDLRSRIYRIAEREIPAHGRVLDLACGTGEDLLILEAKRHDVVGADASPKMLEVARVKCRSHGVEPALVCCRAEHIGTFLPGSFDAIFSNFGGLNCIEDLTMVFDHCHALLRPGGVMILCLINRVCLWEIVAYLLKGRPVKAMRRWRHSGVYVPVGTSGVLTWYHPIARLRAMAGPRFRSTRVLGLNIITPPPSWRTFAMRRRRLIGFLRTLEVLIQGIPPFSRLGDHFVLVLRRNG